MKAYEQQFSHTPDDRRAERLVIVADRSGSMRASDFRPSRIEGLKQAVDALLAAKAEHAAADEAAIASYGSYARVEQPLTPVGPGHDRLRRATQGIAIDGGTNITTGLQAAAGLLLGSTGTSKAGGGVAALLKSLEHWMFEPAATPSQDAAPSPLLRILLLTDGHHNEGPSPRKAAHELRDRGVVIQAIGIGGAPEDVDETLLKSIVSPDARGQPQYLFIGAEQGTSTLIQAFRQRASYPKAPEHGDPSC